MKRGRDLMTALSPKKKKKTLVVTGVNLVDGGPLTVFVDCINAIAECVSKDDWQIFVFVNRKGLVPEKDGITQIEVPCAKKSWSRRMYVEWVYFPKVARKLQPDVWMSIHDITPPAQARKMAVYCHNPSPFMPLSLETLRVEPKLVLFRLFYGYLYGLQIQRNDWVIVQQNWMADEFTRRYRPRQMVVARPVHQDGAQRTPTVRTGKPFAFFYPAFPRSFKNFEQICDAVALLEQDPSWQHEVWFTVSGTENKYTREIFSRYQHLRSVRWLGLRPHHEVLDLYGKSSCLIFPSTLETWGLPLSEAKTFGLPILAIDLPYAHETVGTYDKVSFFPVRDPARLAERMRDIAQGNTDFHFHHAPAVNPQYRQCENWPQLLELLTSPDACEQ
jgi:glycosyltransferase involved in cell wall biosynthesis